MKRKAHIISTTYVPKWALWVVDCHTCGFRTTSAHTNELDKRVSEHYPINYEVRM